MDMSMSFTEKRRYERKPFVQRVKYYLPAFHREKDRIYSYGDTIDISEGGIGMITHFPLKRGDILFFEPELTVNSIVAKSSVVRWTKESDSKYRVGLEFVREG
jgi:c-di-GMP-binding flagellar brake protein YcgR